LPITVRTGRWDIDTQTTPHIPYLRLDDWDRAVQEFTAYDIIQGSPNVIERTIGGDGVVALVSYDNQGAPDGILTINVRNGDRDIIVDPAARRTGVATRLYDTADELGYAWDQLADTGKNLDEGAMAFLERRLEKVQDQPITIDAAIPDRAQFRTDEEWAATVRRMAALGQLPEAAMNRVRTNLLGFGESGIILPLPPVLYRASIDMGNVMRSMRFKARREVNTEGLGGGPDHTISFAEDLQAAERVAEVWREVHDLWNGHLDIEDLPGIPLDELQNLYGFSGLMTKMNAYGISRLSDVGKKRIPPDLAEEFWRFYKSYLQYLDGAGEATDPYIAGKPDLDRIRKVPRENIGVVEAHSQTGAYGAKLDDPVGAEWRIWHPEAVVIQRKARLAPEQYLDRLMRREYLADREALRQAKLARLEAKNQVEELRRRAEPVLTVKMDDTWYNPETGEWKMPLEDMERLIEEERFLRENNPGYTLKQPPRLAIPFRPQDSLPASLMIQRSNLATVLFDYGPISHVGHFIEWLTGPVSSAGRAADARQQVYNLLIPLGARSEDVTTYLRALMERSQMNRVGPYEAPLFKGITAITPDDMKVIARDVFGVDSPVYKAVEQKYKGRWHDVIDSAYNSAIRRIQQKMMDGKTPNVLEALLNEGWSIWHNTPGFRSVVADGTRFISKVAYPLFRFQLDPRWLAMNLIEADILGLLKDGINGTRKGADKRTLAVNTRTGKTVDVSAESYNFHRARAHMGATNSSRVMSQEIMNDAGIFLEHKNLAIVLGKRFDLSRIENLRAALDALPEEAQIIKLLEQRFGKDRRTWGMQLDDMMYNYAQRGVAKTIRQEAMEIKNNQHWTEQEWLNMAPFIDRLIELNQRTFDDIVAVHVGNISRSRLERVLNSFWLYWPISYQIKASKWLFDVMSNRAFGKQTNLGGAALFSYNQENFKEQMARNPAFRQQFQENEVLWFMASMMFPLTPVDVGVTLNRGVRYVGGNLFHLWPEYTSIEGPEDVIVRMLSLGPIYTAELLTRVLETVDVQIPTFDEINQTETEPVFQERPY
jgi:hypothetical protein